MMKGSPPRRHVHGWVLGAVLAGLALTGCTSAPTATPTPAPEVTSPAPTPSPSAASPSAAASRTPAPKPVEPTPVPAEPGPAELTIDITIADGQVTPNGQKLDVQVGQPIVLYVTSDEDDEVHAHTDSGDGYELEVKAGSKVRGEFMLMSPGRYEVESHHLEKTIVILNAR